jgi:hypothetical protein
MGGCCASGVNSHNGAGSVANNRGVPRVISGANSGAAGNTGPRVINYLSNPTVGKSLIQNE